MSDAKGQEAGPSCHERPSGGTAEAGFPSAFTSANPAIGGQPRDRVRFGKWSDTEVKVYGTDHLILEQCDSLGMLQKAGCVPTTNKGR